MRNVGHMRILRQVIDDLQCILGMTLYAERQGLDALQEQPCIERCKGCALVTQNDGTKIGSDGGRCAVGSEGYTMVGLVLRGEPWPLLRLVPVELAGIDDDAADGGSVTTDELRRRMNDDVGTVLDRTDLYRGCEGVIDDEREVMLVSDLYPLVEVEDLTVRVTEGLGIEGLRVQLDGCLYLLVIVRIDERGRYAVVGKGMGEVIVGSAVDVLRGNDVVTGMRNGLKCVGNRSCTGCNTEGGDTTLEGGDSLLEDILSRVRQSRIDVTCILQRETGGCMIRIVKYECAGLVDRNRSRTGGWIRVFLSYMDGLGIKSVISVYIWLLRHDVLLLQLRLRVPICEAPKLSSMIQVASAVCIGVFIPMFSSLRSSVS